MDDYASNFPHEPVAARIVRAQQSNSAAAVNIDDDTFYHFCGGYEDGLTGPPSGFSAVNGTTTITSGRVEVENLVIGVFDG